MASIFGRNFEALRRSQNMTQPQMADKIGVSTVTISKWENGKVKIPKQDDVIKLIKDSFGVTDSDLFSDTNGFYAKSLGLSALPTDALPLTPSKGHAYMPLYGKVHAGDAEEPVLVDDHVPVPLEVAERHPNGYLLIVKGTCMDRVYPEGCLILVDPDIEPRNGSIGVFRIDGGEHIMRRYYRGQSSIMLCPDSHDSQWEDMVFSEGYESRIESCGTVVWFQARKELA